MEGESGQFPGGPVAAGKNRRNLSSCWAPRGSWTARWNKPTLADQISFRITRNDFFLIGILLLALQLFWLYRMHGRGLFRKTDGALLAVLGGSLMLIFMALELHPGFMIAYPLILTFLGLAAVPKRGGRGRENE
jgi:hypothetical protein